MLFFSPTSFSWDTDPFIRHTFWTVVVGGGMMALTIYSANQAMLQRYLSMRTLKTAKW